MPSVTIPRSGEDKNKTVLKITQADRDIWINACGLCERVRELSTGSNAEVGSEMEQLHVALLPWCETSKVILKPAPF